MDYSYVEVFVFCFNWYSQVSSGSGLIERVTVLFLNVHDCLSFIHYLSLLFSCDVPFFFFVLHLYCFSFTYCCCLFFPHCVAFFIALFCMSTAVSYLLTVFCLLISCTFAVVFCVIHLSPPPLFSLTSAHTLPLTGVCF